MPANGRRDLIRRLEVKQSGLDASIEPNLQPDIAAEFEDPNITKSTVLMAEKPSQTFAKPSGDRMPARALPLSAHGMLTPMEPVWRPGYGLECPGFKFRLEQQIYLFSRTMSILIYLVPRLLTFKRRASSI